MSGELTHTTHPRECLAPVDLAADWLERAGVEVLPWQRAHLEALLTSTTYPREYLARG